MFEAYKIGVAITLTNHVSSVLGAITRDFRHTEVEAALLQKRLDSIKLGLKGGLISIGVGAAIAAAFKPAIDDAMKFERAMLRLKDIGGIDAKVVMQVRTDALSGRYKGIGAAESVDLVRDLHAAFGDAKEALEFMPLFAGMARVTQGKYGKSAVAGEEDVRALAKLAERRGGTKSPAAMESAMDLSMRIQNASGGAVTPKDLLAFTARMGAMGNAMSNDGVMKMWALMQEQGGSKAGTALNSAMQNMVNGRGTEGSGSVLRKIGWIDEEKNAEGLQSLYGATWSKHLNKVTANALKNSDLAKQDMVGWVQTTGLPLIEQYLDKQGVTDPKKREGETVSLLAQALSNRLGADSIALIATQLPRIMKDYHVATGSAGLRDSVKSYDDSPMARFQELHARWETALVNLGLGALPVVIPLVNRLADAFKSFNQFAEKSPSTVKAIAGGLLGLAGALITLGSLTVAINGVRALSIVLGVAGSVGTTLVGALGAAAPAVGVLAAALGGYAVGSLIYSLIEGSSAADTFGRAIARLLAFFGNDGARAALAAEERVKNPPGSARTGEWEAGAAGVDTAGGANVRYRTPTRGAALRTGEWSSAVPPATKAPIQVTTTVNLDGRKVGEAVTRHQEREAARPQTGGQGFDGTVAPRGSNMSPAGAY